MQKPFLTYDQQIDHLISKKKLIISDKAFAESALKNIGYFALIGGYKQAFMDPMTRRYEQATRFEDIYELYQFDKTLREIVFKYICEVELMIRQYVSYAFCSVYGDNQSAYLDRSNYVDNFGEVRKLQNILYHIAVESTDHAYIVHQRTAHQNVPLWVLLNAVSFGQLSHFYSLLPEKVRVSVSKNFPNVKEKNLGTYLAMLTLFRNVCAHNERLFSYKVGRQDFPDMPLHQKLDIPKRGAQYLYGKKDLFGVVIALRYLLPEGSFTKFKSSLAEAISDYLSKSSRIKEPELLDMMGFPQNWDTITYAD